MVSQLETSTFLTGGPYDGLVGCFCDDDGTRERGVWTYFLGLSCLWICPAHVPTTPYIHMKSHLPLMA